MQKKITKPIAKTVQQSDFFPFLGRNLLSPRNERASASLSRKMLNRVFQRCERLLGKSLNSVISF